MADARGLQINKDIFEFEEFIDILTDKLPKTFRYSTRHRHLEEHVIEMRHYTNLACRVPKWNKKEKVTLFSMASGFALDVADDLDHEYNRHWLSVAIRPEKTRLAYTIRKNRQHRKLIYKNYDYGYTTENQWP